MFVRSCIPQTRTRESGRESLSESNCQIWSTSWGICADFKEWIRCRDAIGNGALPRGLLLKGAKTIKKQAIQCCRWQIAGLAGLGLVGPDGLGLSDRQRQNQRISLEGVDGNEPQSSFRAIYAAPA
jgi:hypothetical protein